jgi:hypothetical protein
MRGRPKINATAPIRSSFADAALAVEERLVWGGADLLRAAADAIRWPFERLVWAVERSLVWPLEERSNGWSGSARAGGAIALALLAAGAGVSGLLWASGNGGSTTVGREASTPLVRPVAAAPASPAPVLHGPAPDFKAASGGSPNADAPVTSKAATSKAAATAEPAETTAATGAAAPTELSSATSSKAPVVAAGPVATKVAHRFAGAFVLYETGQGNAKVRAAFMETATPKLAHSLLRRPPRLPANVKVPKAKVLNIVPGPKRGDTYTMSVSLLRVGLTSELRIAMQQDERSGEWRVKEILG